MHKIAENFHIWKAGTALKKLIWIFMFIICVPVAASFIIKPEQRISEEGKNDIDVTELPFSVIVKESNGTYEYTPEDIVPYMVSALVPWDVLSDFDDTVNPAKKRQEYLKALAIICRTNLVYEWEQHMRPKHLDLYKSGLYIKKRSGNPSGFDEIVEAVRDTTGAVITDKNSERRTVIAAPFYTTSDWDISIGMAGRGDGLSVNYAAELAKEGKDFNEILNYFYDDIQIDLSSGN